MISRREAESSRRNLGVEMKTHSLAPLTAFVAESNKIEGIHRPPTDAEVAAHVTFLERARVSVKAMEDFVHVIQPGARLRSRKGLDVRVGNYFPPPGGPGIKHKLKWLLERTKENSMLASGTIKDPWRLHVEYERLHPFTDGNGRSGRVLWAWYMQKLGKDPFALSFLHRAYYQSLDASR